jgi:predicted nuclease with TOPRIM domain
MIADQGVARTTDTQDGLHKRFVKEGQAAVTTMEMTVPVEETIRALTEDHHDLLDEIQRLQGRMTSLVVYQSELIGDLERAQAKVRELDNVVDILATENQRLRDELDLVR